MGAPPDGTASTAAAPRATRDVAVIGASAGGIPALQALLAGIPAQHAGTVLVVLHLAQGSGSALADILARSTPLTVSTATDGEPLRAGHVHVCRPDRHLLLGDGTALVRRGPLENGHRPAIDALLRSAAVYYGPRAIGVVLSGTRTDGTAGLAAIRREGGVAVVQDPEDALFDEMPASALARAGADHVFPAREIGPLVARLGTERVAPARRPPDPGLRLEVAVVEGIDDPLALDRPGHPSPWPCPDCHGVLWEIDDPAVVRFRCRVGHAWDGEALVGAQRHQTERQLWSMLRSLEDRRALHARLAERAERDGRPADAHRHRVESATEARRLSSIRAMLRAGPPTGGEGR